MRSLSVLGLGTGTGLLHLPVLGGTCGRSFAIVSNLGALLPILSFSF